MLTKKFIIPSIIISAATLYGCASSNVNVECTVSKESGQKPSWKCSASGRINAANNLLRRVSALVAETGIYTYDHYLAMDPTKYTIELAGTANSYIENNQATISVFDGTNLLGQKVTTLTKNGNIYKFADPQGVKNWAYNYIDIADKVDVKYKTVTTGSENDYTISNLKDSGVLKAAVTYAIPHDVSPITPPRHEN